MLKFIFVDDSNGSPELSNDYKESSYLSIQNEVSQQNLPDDDPQKSNKTSNDKKDIDGTPIR